MKHTLQGAGNVCAVVDLACVQAQAGHDVTVCSSVDDFQEVLSRHGVKYVRVNQMFKGPRLLGALYQIHRTLAVIRPQIVHAHMISSALFAAILQPLLGYRLVTTVHNEFQPSAVLMGVGHRVIGVSEAVTRSMLLRGLPRSRMRTVLNGSVNSPRRPPPTPAAEALSRPAIITVCGMHPRKGVTDLVRAFGTVLAHHPDAHLYVVGSGPMLEAYSNMGREIGGDHVHFVGHMDDPRPLLLGADVFVLASLAEPAGLVLSEAREAGCAIIATQVGGIPEMVENGEAALLVPPQRPDLLADAIISLLDDPALAARLRARGQQNLALFDVRRVAAETEAVYAELLAAGRS